MLKLWNSIKNVEIIRYYRFKMMQLIFVYMMLGVGKDVIGTNKHEKSSSKMSVAVYLVALQAASAYSVDAQSTRPYAALDPKVFLGV